MKAKIADNIKTGRRGLPGGESTPASAPSSDTLDPVVRQCSTCRHYEDRGWITHPNGDLVDDGYCRKHDYKKYGPDLCSDKDWEALPNDKHEARP